MKELHSLNWIAIVLVILGAINWGLVGIVGVDLVNYMFGDTQTFARVVYTLIGISGLYLASIAKGLQKR